MGKSVAEIVTKVIGPNVKGRVFFAKIIIIIIICSFQGISKP